MAFCHKCGKELPSEASFCPSCGTPVPATAQFSSAASAMGPQTARIVPHYATVGDRTVAVILDTFILLVATLVLAIPIGLLSVFGPGLFPAFFFGGFTLLWWLVWLVYFSFFEGTSGQTLGKQAVGIKAIDEVSRKPPRIEQALLRNILRIIDWLPFLYLIGFILVETQPNKKRLGDIVARTVVVRS